jgi:hypothetical protein
MDRSLMDACVVLLGPQARRGGQAFLQKLDVAVLRRAWRTLALATHPDAARRPGARGGTADGRRFIEASHAYELLMAWLLKGPAARHAAPPTPRHRPAPAAGRAGESTGAKKTARPAGGRTGDSAGARKTARPAGGPLFYHGPLPRRGLRLAEYLYYSGRISWQSLISALVWQRAARPRFGELARELASITGPELMKILGSKLQSEQTGETARRLRLLTAAQVERILRLQRLRHKRIGRYFVEKESMPGAELSAILRELSRHNARFRPSS